MLGRRKQQAAGRESASSRALLSVSGAWPTDSISTAEITQWCALALSADVDPALQLLKESVLSPGSYHAPIATGSSMSMAWATWHHGSDYQTYWCGDAMSLLHYAATTDTEREQFILQARKATSNGLIPYAVGVSITPSVPSKPHIGIEYAHLLYMQPSAYQATR